MFIVSFAGKLCSCHRTRTLRFDVSNNTPPYAPYTRSDFYTNAPASTESTVCGGNCTCSKNKKYATEKSIPGYKYIKFLGSGDFGAVHLYRSNKTLNPVAIKEISYKIKGKTILHEVSTEYEIVMGLNHPNITRYYDFFLITNRFKCYVVMEYAKRGTLRQLLQERIKTWTLLEQNSVLRMTHDIIRGVQFLNRNHVVHCDLKPENILIDDSGKLKICDFGTAHFVFDVDGPLSSTLAYTAPERFEGMLPDEKSEVWAIGIIFYEMCTLTHPFGPFATNTEMIRKIKEGRFKPITCSGGGYSPNMQDLLYLMSHTDREHRQNLSNILRHQWLRPIQSKSKY